MVMLDLVNADVGRSWSCSVAQMFNKCQLKQSSLDETIACPDADPFEVTHFIITFVCFEVKYKITSHSHFRYFLCPRWTSFFCIFILSQSFVVKALLLIQSSCSADMSSFAALFFYPVLSCDKS